MNDQIKKFEPKNIFKFIGYKGSYYKILFYYDYQTEIALRLMNQQDEDCWIDRGSMVSDQCSK